MSAFELALDVRWFLALSMVFGAGLLGCKTTPVDALIARQKEPLDAGSSARSNKQFVAAFQGDAGETSGDRDASAGAQSTPSPPRASNEKRPFGGIQFGNGTAIQTRADGGTCDSVTEIPDSAFFSMKLASNGNCLAAGTDNSQFGRASVLDTRASHQCDGSPRQRWHFYPDSQGASDDSNDFGGFSSSDTSDWATADDKDDEFDADSGTSTWGNSDPWTNSDGALDAGAISSPMQAATGASNIPDGGSPTSATRNPPTEKELAPTISDAGHSADALDASGQNPGETLCASGLSQCDVPQASMRLKDDPKATFLIYSNDYFLAVEDGPHKAGADLVLYPTLGRAEQQRFTLTIVANRFVSLSPVETPDLCLTEMTTDVELAGCEPDNSAQHWELFPDCRSAVF